MNISKTTENFAKRRGLEVEVGEPLGELPNPIIWIWEADEDSEPMFCYLVNDDDTLSFRGNVYLKESIKEELPARINSEQHLREVLDFVATELKAPEMDFSAMIQEATQPKVDSNNPKPKASKPSGMKM